MLAEVCAHSTQSPNAIEMLASVIHNDQASD